MHQLHCLCGTLRWLGALLHLVLSQHLAEGDLALELRPGQRGDLEVWETGLEYAGGQLQALEHVGEEEPVAGPARTARGLCVRGCPGSTPGLRSPGAPFPFQPFLLVTVLVPVAGQKLSGVEIC